MFTTVAFPKVAVVLLMFTVPALDPSDKAVAAPKALIVVAVALNNVNVVAAVATVGLLIVNVPVDAPNVIAVAAPKALTVRLLVLNNVTVPDVEA